jgi:hypothetical protein
MRHVRITLLFWLLTFLASAQQPDSTGGKHRVCIAKEVCFAFPVTYTSSPELLQSLRQVNDKILYVAGLQAQKGEKPVLFSVSKYVSEQALSVDSAFQATVHFKAAPSSAYQLVDYGTYTRGKVTLRYKISKVRFQSGVEVLSIMSYFMPSQVSQVFYELKCSCPPQWKAQCLQLMEKIAVSISFAS